MDKKSYIAGIIDGEGSVMLTKMNGKYRIPTVSVSNTTYELITFLQSEYGGVVSTQKTYKKHYKQSWTWVLRYNDALRFLEDIVELLIVPQKRKRAEFILSKYKTLTRRNGKYTDAEKRAKLKFEEDFFQIVREKHG